MYKKRISPTTSKITPNSHPQFFKRRSEIVFADTTYIDSVCSVLLESRFGPGFVYQKMKIPSSLRDFERVAFSDLLDDGARNCGRKRECERACIKTLGRTRCHVCLRSGKFSGTRMSEPGAIATGFLNLNSQSRGSP